MIYNNERHKEIVIYSQYLKSQGKRISKEDSEKYSELLTYNIAVEEQVFWAHKEEFLRIMSKFLENILDFDEFETDFSLFYRKVRTEFNKFRRDVEQIDKFQPSTRPYRFASFMTAIYRQFEEVEDEYCTEQEARDYIKEAYLELQKFSLVPLSNKLSYEKLIFRSLNMLTFIIVSEIVLVLVYLFMGN